MLELSHLKKTFAGPDGEVRALDDVSLRVEAGDIVAIEGPSGSGKSTLLLIAGGLLAPSAGEVRLDGVDPYALDSGARARWRARRVGFVFQQFHLIPYLNALENALAPTLALAAPGAEKRAGELLEGLGLSHRRHHVPAALSVGERQRVAMARALLQRPALVLADEPTGNLDDENAQAILEHLVDYAGQGAAVILATHDARLSAHARARYRLHGGRLDGG
jgi:ABC-type lipoprotein export system ATPase subunit